MKGRLARLALTLAAFGAFILSVSGLCGTPETTFPYGIDKRPMPSGQDLAILVPPAVGKYQRKPFTPEKQFTGETLFAVYNGGPGTVFFGVNLYADPADARHDVSVSRGFIAHASKDEQTSLTTEPAFFHIPEFMTWTRGGYYFYALADSPKALDAFMKAFPF